MVIPMYRRSTFQQNQAFGANTPTKFFRAMFALAFYSKIYVTIDGG